MRRQFVLSEEDEEGLTALGLDWESVVENEVKWIIVHGYQIPAEFNCVVADVALRIPPSYPDDQIDMAYFFPPLALKNGRHIGALTAFAIDGKSYQQWSRHRTAANPWRPGLDNICTHLLQVDSWLAKEAKA